MKSKLFIIGIILTLATASARAADPTPPYTWHGDRWIIGDLYVDQIFGNVSGATITDVSNQIPQDDLEYIFSELWYKTGIAYNQRYRWDGGAAGLDAVLGRQSLGLGTAALRNAEDTLTNGSNLPDGAAIISYINGRGFITDPNDSVQPSELDGTFSTVGLLKRLGAGSYTTVPDNSANWDQAFGWGNHATQGYLKTYNPNDSVDASELEVLFGPLGAGLMIHSASGQFNVTPDNHANWDTAYSWGNHATQGYLKSYNPNDSVSGAELDAELFDANGILIKSASGTFSTTPDNHVNWDTAYGWGNHASVGYLKPPHQNDSVDASELEVLFGPLGAGLLIRSGSGQFNTTPNNQKQWDTAYNNIVVSASNWQTAYNERQQWDGGSTNLDAEMGRNSLGLGSAALSLATDFAGAAHNHGTGTTGNLTRWNVGASGTIMNATVKESASSFIVNENLNLQGYYLHKLFNVVIPAAAGTYVCYLKFPVSTGVYGVIKLRLSGQYNTNITTGNLEYQYIFGGSGGTTWKYEMQCTQAQGNTPTYFAAGDVVWNATESRYVIPIYQRTGRNYVLLEVEYYSNNAMTDNYDLTLSNWEAWGTQPPISYPYYNNRLGIKTSAPSYDLDINGTARISKLVGVGADNTYGTISFQGTKNGYAGINFRNPSDLNLGSFLLTTQYGGVYNSADTGWVWRFNNGVLDIGSIASAQQISDITTYVDNEVSRLIAASNALSENYSGPGGSLTLSVRYDNATIKTNIDNQLYVNPGEIPFSGLKGVSVSGVSDNQILKYMAGSWIAAATADDDDGLKTVDWDNFIDRAAHHVDMNALELGGVYILDGYSTNDLFVRVDGKIRLFDSSPVGTPGGGSFGGEYYNGNSEGQWWDVASDKTFTWKTGAVAQMILSVTDLNMQGNDITDTNNVVANGAVFAKNRHYAWDGTGWAGGVSSGGAQPFVTALRWNGGTLQYKTRTIGIVQGIVTWFNYESDWMNVP